MKILPSIPAAAAFLAALSSGAYAADLTWNGPDPGTWDAGTTANWTGATTTWTNGDNAIFNAGTYQVDLTSTGVTVGDLTYGGGGTLEFRGSTASGSLGDLITVNSGGATWDTGGGEIEFFNDGNNNNTRLAVGSGDTLTITGGGVFDTGQNPQNDANGNWSVAGSTLDVTAATVLRGNARTLGQFGTVKLAGGSTVIQERNADQTLNASGNTWELNGDVTFGNRFNRRSYMTGVISGTGRLIYKDGASQNLGFLRIDNAANTFSGGVTVDAENNATMVYLNNSNDGVLGAAPASFDADNIILKNGGTLRSNQNLTTNANRGITLDNGGILNVSNSRTFTIGGAITGDGGLQIGYVGGHAGLLALAGANASYTGETQIFEGNVRIEATNAMGQGVLNLGGTEGFARLILNGQSQTIGGLYNTGSQTKQIVNVNNTGTGSTTGTLIFDIANGDDYAAGSATGVNAGDNRGNFNIVKNGLGRQELGNLQLGGDVTVNAGTLQVGNNGGASAIGNASVTGGTLVIAETVTATSYATSAGGTLQFGTGGTLGNIAGNISNSGEVVINRSNGVNYSGVISGIGSLKLTGGGDHVLGVAQSYTGATAVDNAVLTAGVTNVLSSDSAVTLGGAGSGTSALEMNGFSQHIGGLAFAAGSHTREVRNNGANATLTLDVATGESYAYNANFVGTGTVDLVKTGDGTQTFGRSGTYTTALGNVTVNGGELVWNNNNSATVSGTITVGSGATLSGSGINIGAGSTLAGVGNINGVATVAGALNPGNSPGTLTFSESLTLESTATLTLEFASTSSFDILKNDGEDTFTASGTLALELLGYTAVEDDTFVVLEDWGSFAGSFDTITGTDLGGGLEFDTSDLLTTGTITVVAVIPETSTSILTMLAVIGFAARRRR